MSKISDPAPPDASCTDFGFAEVDFPRLSQPRLVIRFADGLQLLLSDPIDLVSDARKPTTGTALHYGRSFLLRAGFFHHLDIDSLMEVVVDETNRGGATGGKAFGEFDRVFSAGGNTDWMVMRIS